MSESEEELEKKNLAKFPKAKEPHQEEFLEAVFSGTIRDITNHLSKLDEKSRRKLNSFAKKMLSAANSAKHTKNTEQRKRRAHCFLLLTSTAAEIRKRKSFVDLVYHFRFTSILAPEELPAFLTSMSPECLGSWISLCLEGQDPEVDFVFSLVEEESIPFPESTRFPLLVLLMTIPQDLIYSKPSLESIKEVYDRHLLVLRRHLEFSARATFSAQDGDQILTSQVFQFVDPNTKEIVPYLSWEETLLSAVNEKKLDGVEFLKLSARAISETSRMDLAKCYSRFYLRLIEQENLEEEARKLEREHLLPWLASDVRNTQNFALDRLNSGVKEGLLPSVDVVSRLCELLPAMTKGNAKRSLGVLRVTLQKKKESRAEALMTILQSLLHPDSSIQDAVLKLIEKYPGDLPSSFSEECALYLELLSAPIQMRLKALGVDSVEDKTEEIADETDSTEEFSPLELIKDPDELLIAVSSFWQNEIPHLEVEVLLASLCETRPTLGEEWNKKLEGFITLLGEPDPRDASWETRVLTSLCGDLFLDWTKARDAGGPIEERLKVLGPSIRKHIDEYLKRFAPKVFLSYLDELRMVVSEKTPRPWLALPSNSSGFLSAEDLIERYQQCVELGMNPGKTELMVAILRLSKLGRTDALKNCPEWKTEEGKAIRFALGDKTSPDDEEYWLVAARSLQPRGSIENRPKDTKLHGPSAWDDWKVERTYFPAEVHGKDDPNFFYSSPLRYSAYEFLSVEPEPLDPEDGKLPMSLFNKTLNKENRPNYRPNFYWADKEIISWRCSVWPANSDPALGRAFNFMYFGKDESPGNPLENKIRAYLDGIFCRPHGELGYPVIILALNSAGKSCQATGIHWMLKNLSQKWFNKECFGKEFSQMLNQEILKMNRILPALKEIAMVSSHTRNCLSEIYSMVFQETLKFVPRGFPGFLEHIYEVAFEFQDHFKGRDFPGLAGHKGKAGTVARKIVKLSK